MSAHLYDTPCGICKLSPDPVLTHVRQTQPFIQVEQHFSEESDVYLVPSTILAAYMRMTLEGLGVACMPRAMVAEEIEQGRLVQIRYKWVPDNLSTDARFHAEKAPYHLCQDAELARDMARDYTSR